VQQHEIREQQANQQMRPDQQQQQATEQRRQVPLLQQHHQAVVPEPQAQVIRPQTISAHDYIQEVRRPRVNNNSSH
jgi:hypothetical protein